MIGRSVTIEPNEWARRMVEERMDHYQLTDKQREVCWLMLAGVENTDIARMLRVSRKAVQSHIERLKVKTGAVTLVQLALMMVGFGSIAYDSPEARGHIPAAEMRHEPHSTIETL